jgi:hypothetical protein
MLLFMQKWPLYYSLPWIHYSLSSLFFGLSFGFLCGYSLTQQFSPELEHDECGLYLQQSSPPIDSTAGFSGIVIASKILLFNY